MSPTTLSTGLAIAKPPAVTAAVYPRKKPTPAGAWLRPTVCDYDLEMVKELRFIFRVSRLAPGSLTQNTSSAAPPGAVAAGAPPSL